MQKYHHQDPRPKNLKDKKLLKWQYEMHQAYYQACDASVRDNTARFEAYPNDYDIFELRLDRTFRDAGFGLSDLGFYKIDADSLTRQCQEFGRMVLNNRKLRVRRLDAAFLETPGAILGPDDIERVCLSGVFIYSSSAYNLFSPIVIYRDLDVEQFQFFFLLRMKSIDNGKIWGFLDYHLRFSFDGDIEEFTEFLTGIFDASEDPDLVGDEDIRKIGIPKSKFEKAKRWIENRMKIPVHADSKQRPIAISIEPSSFRKSLLGKLKKEEWERMLDFLCEYPIYKGRPALTLHEVQCLKEEGFIVYTDKSPLYCSMNLSRLTLQIVRALFYRIWQINGGEKDEIALYLKSHFSNFDIDQKSLANKLLMPSSSVKSLFEKYEPRR